jgi:hypothetical protein
VTTPFVAYTIAWILACAVAVWLALKRRGTIELVQRRYWRFLLQPWKGVTFLISAIGLTVMAPYTGDPTWDYFDGAVMSILTFATAPWATGTLYRAIRREASWAHGYIALCVWMFSVSWFYDLYIYLRDGMYPDTWLPNIFLSSVLYVAAGLLWSLEWRPERGVVLQFTEPHWPERDAVPRFGRIVWFALPFMIIAAAVTLPFLL